jgi:hypothetical protein
VGCFATVVVVLLRGGDSVEAVVRALCGATWGCYGLVWIGVGDYFGLGFGVDVGTICGLELIWYRGGRVCGACCG